MTARFDYFVVLAGMRTGSNLLEEQLAAMPGIVSYGELFNPHFFGKPEIVEKWGLPIRERNRQPLQVIRAMQENSSALPGFRLFHDHDARVVDHVLNDPRAAKIVLSRNAVDSYVSLKIARKTGQWWLGDMKSARQAKVAFDAGEFADFLSELRDFRQRIHHALQTTGQTAFHIGYDDLSDDDVLAGLGRFLGSDGPPDPAKVQAKVQNPTQVSERLTNPRVAEEALARMAAPDIGRFPDHEPDRGPGLRFFLVGQTAPLIYAPIRGAWDDPVPDWLKSVDPDGKTDKGMTQKDLRRWKRQHPGHRAFTVLRHPLLRAHDAFCQLLLQSEGGGDDDLRSILAGQYDVPLPDPAGESHDLPQHRTAFLAFLKFLAGNLGGQTSVRVDNSWATQSVLLQAIGKFAVPDRVIRSDALQEDLPRLAAEVGMTAPVPPADNGTCTPFSLTDVWTPEIEAACEAAYRRDYVMFGFRSWPGGDQAA